MHFAKILGTWALSAMAGKDIVFRFIIEYSSFKVFWPLGNRSISIIWGFLKDDILACVETWDELLCYNILKDFSFF
jgi:hypothetical protein